MNDLAVQDGRPAGEIPGDGLRQRFECFEPFRLRDTNRQAPPSI
jgi:hypothetical protein